MTKRYPFTLITLHWTTVALLAWLYITGEDMEHLERGPEKTALVDLHSALGFTILLIVLARLAIRRRKSLPEKPVSSSISEHKWAAGVHFGLYATMVIQVVLGMLTIFTVGKGLDYFGLFVIPSPMAKDIPLHHFFEDSHVVFYWSIFLLAGVHIAAALLHHFWRKDGLIKRMLPFGS